MKLIGRLENPEPLPNPATITVYFCPADRSTLIVLSPSRHAAVDAKGTTAIPVKATTGVSVAMGQTSVTAKTY